MTEAKGKQLNILLLGGTGDGKQLATAINALPLAGKRIYSVAGKVSSEAPEQWQLVSGGFSQYDDSSLCLSSDNGLAQFLALHKIDLVIDATHPYALQISQNAQQACASQQVSYWRFQRPGFQQQQGDRWHYFNDWPQLLEYAAEFDSVLFTSGQPNEFIYQWLGQPERGDKRYFLRAALPPTPSLPDNARFIQARGPFAVGDELALLALLQIKALVSKDSGGSATAAKLEAARQLGLPVLFLARPEFALADESQQLQEQRSFSDQASLIQQLQVFC